MRLARKLTATVILGMLVVFGVRGYLGAKREIAILATQMRENQETIARSLRPALVNVWRGEGKAKALDLLRYADDRMRKVRIRWVSFDEAPGGPHQPLAALDALARVRSGEEVTQTLGRGEQQQHVTYLPVTISGRVEGALEVSESMQVQQQLIRDAVRDVLLATAAAVVVSAILAVLAGIVIVGRPVRALVEKARRIGRGDLTGPVVMRQNDELGELSQEMNAMCEMLAGEIAARERTTDQLRHADRLATVGKLASGIAHELGTPLHVVAGHAKLIARREISGSEAAEGASVIAEQADRMTRIIRQLLDFARRRGPQRASCDLVELARTSVAMLEPLAQKRGVHLHVVGEPRLVFADVDAGQFQQALTNLVMNGIQATSRDGALWVELGGAVTAVGPGDSGRAAPHVTVKVRDQGSGIPPKHVPRIFEPFFTTKAVGEGTGLGLSVVYGIARDHGGWIDVVSELGKGSTFTIWLPCAGASGGPA
jgi:two-component system NtrC family sensor kinase